VPSLSCYARLHRLRNSGLATRGQCPLGPIRPTPTLLLQLNDDRVCVAAEQHFGVRSIAVIK
jgi:hypothetical protein